MRRCGMSEEDIAVDLDRKMSDRPMEFSKLSPLPGTEVGGFYIGADYGYDDAPKFYPEGRILKKVKQEGAAVVMEFEGSTVTLAREGDGCAHAFFTELEIGSDLPARLTEGNSVAAGRKDAEYGDVRDTEFIKIKTDKGYIDFTLHTDHNGYYGGRWFVASEVAE